MGGRSSSSNINTSQNGMAAQASNAQRTAVEDNVRSQISSIKARRFSSGELVNPRNGHNLSFSVERVATRDYWGNRTGEQTYTLYVWDNDDRDGAGNPNRLYYNYGMDSLSRVKDELRRITGVTRRGGVR